MRPLHLPRLSTSSIQQPSDKMESNNNNTTSPHHHSPTHSRDSSAGSNTSTPMTPTFSFRTHTRWPSSSSSLATSPDSPVNVAKSSLDDLVEEPSEIDDLADRSVPDSLEEFCICDTVHCKHQQISPPASPEWIPGDDHLDFPDPPRSLKSQKSIELGGSRKSRLSRHWPSISSRWRDKWPTTSLSNAAVRSAPPSRAASAKSTSVRQSLANYLEPHGSMVLSAPDRKSFGEDLSRPRSATLPQPIAANRAESEEPIDRKELASTPLLPPAVTDLRTQHDDDFQSPLQSPSIASPTETPLHSPVMPATYTPPLSAKPSYGSIYRVSSNRISRPSVDTTHPENHSEPDYWAMKLGHANFHIHPEPYMPETPSREACTRLLADWETARIEYMKQAMVISAEYGVASQTYRLTAEKWSQIDRQWQTNLDRAKREAAASGETPHQESLAKTQTVCKLPSLPFDPANPQKFPASDREGGIVGPMVQYAKVQRTPSKRSNLMKLFLDPTSLFGGRARR